MKSSPAPFSCKFQRNPRCLGRNKFIFVLIGFLISNLKADLIEGVGEVQASYSYIAGAGDYVKTGDDSATLLLGDALNINIDLGGETDTWEFEGLLIGSLTGYASFNDTVDAATGEQTHAQINGEQSSDATMTGTGNHKVLNFETATGLAISSSPGNAMTYPFTVTDADAEGEIRVSISSESVTGGNSSLKLQKNIGGTWSIIHYYPSTAKSNFYRETITLDPGQWRFLSEVTMAASINEGKSVETLDFSFIVGSVPGAADLPPEGDYTDDRIYNEYADSPKLTFINPSIVDETSLGDGFTEIEYTVNLVNTSLCPWSRVDWSVREGVVGTKSVENLSPTAIFHDVPATSTVSPSGSQRVKVANDEVGTVSAGILDGSLLTTIGRELLVFRYPVGYVASADDLNTGETSLGSTIPPFGVGPTGFQRDGGVEFKFYVSSEDPMVPGGGPYVKGPLMFLEWEPFYAVPPRKTSAGSGKIWRQNFDSQLPMWVTSASVEGGSIPDPRLTSELSGDTLTYFEILKHGSVSHVIANPLDPYTATATEGSEIDTQNLFPTPLPIHINRIKLGDIAFLSGNINFVPGAFNIRYEMENGIPKEFLVDLSYTAEVNLLLETANHEEVGGSPLVDEQKTLFEAPLFVVTLPGGIVFKPELKIDVGAVVEATRSLSIPFTSKFTIDVTAGIQDGLPYYENRSAIVPIELSDPGVFEAIGAEAKVFVNTEIAAKFAYPSAGLEAGPTIGARLEADFSLTPFANPWWSTSADLKVTAGVELDFAEFFSIIDAEHELDTYEFPIARAEGPLIDGGGVGTATNPGIRPFSDPKERWSRSILPSDGFIAGSEFLIPLTDSTDFLAGMGSTPTSHLYRIAADGNLVAAMKPDTPFFRPIDATPSATGGAFLLGGSPGRLQIVEVDAALNTISSMDFEKGIFYNSLRLLSTPTHHYVLGRTYTGTVVDRAVISCLSHTGTLVWSRLYDLPDNPGMTPADFLISSDGEIVFCATTGADFTNADGLGPNGVQLNITENGFIAKVDTDTGDPIWSTLIVHDQITRYNAIAESPIGEFTIGGSVLRGVVDSKPSMMIVQLTANGDPIESLFIGHSGSAKSHPNPDASGLFVDLPHGGETSFDEIHDLVWTDNGLWGCGEMGINADGDFSTGSTAFTIFFDPKLNPGRFAIHGGRGQDQLKRMIVTPDGPLCYGGSRSFHPWPQGAEDEESNTPWVSWLLKLPWEGRLDFHSLSGGSQPAAEETPLAGSFFVYPRVVSGLLSGSFQINEPVEDSYGRNIGRISGASRTLTATEVSATASTLIVDFTSAEIDELKALDYVPRSLITDQPSYLAWHQLNGDEDFDGDGLDTDCEFFFGTDLFEADAPQASIVSRHPIILTVARNKLAAGQLPTLFDSVDLDTWAPLSPTLVEIETFDSKTDLITMELDALPDLPRRFFQFGSP